MPALNPWLIICLVGLLYCYFTQKAKQIRALFWGICIVLVQANSFISTKQIFTQSDQITSVTGEVTSFVSYHPQGRSLKLSVSDVGGQKLPIGAQGKIVLFLPDSTFISNKHSENDIKKSQVNVSKSPFNTLLAPQLGEIWQFKVKLSPVFGQKNQAGFDKEAYAFSQGIIIAGNVLASNDNQKLHQSDSLRLKLWQEIRPLIEHQTYFGELTALSFGRREFISDERWQALQRSGLAHLMAISGLHIGLAFGIGYFVGKILSVGVFAPARLRLWLYKTKREAYSIAPIQTYLMFSCGLIFAFTYAYLAGFSLSTQRALTMCCVFSCVRLLGMHVHPVKVLAIAALVIHLISPFAMLQSGFWLSFGAVFYLYLAHQSMPLFCKGHNWQAKLRQLIWYQVFISLAMSWLSQTLFQGVSLSAPIVNLVLLPWVSVITVPLIFLGGLSTLFFSSAMSQFIWDIANLSLYPLDFASAYAQNFWHETGTWLAISLDIWFVLPCLWFIYFFLRAYQYVWLAVLIIIVVNVEKDPSDAWQIEVLDVGHGLAVLIGKQGHWLLYDTGDAWQIDADSYHSMAQSVVLPVLKDKAARLDGILISHQDKDHAGGLEEMRRAYPQATVRGSWQASNILTCQQGDTWHWHGLRFEVLWPNQLAHRSYNPHSCVIRIDDGKTSALLTGDIEAVAEYLILRQTSKAKLDVDIVVVPHHGSKTSSREAFVEALSPRYALASYRYFNRWNLPSKVVKQNYLAQGTTWLDTANSGQIRLQISQGVVQIKSERKGEFSPWYRQMLRSKVE